MTQVFKQPCKAPDAQGRDVAERAGESHAPDSSQWGLQRPRQTVQGTPWHEHVHPDSSTEAPGQLCGH